MLSEGFSDTAVQPLPGDKWTIGYGHTGDVKPGDSITRREALDLLGKDVSWAEAAVNRLVTIELKQCEFDALVSLVYNIGETAFASSSLLKALNRGDRAEVEVQWMRWCYFKGKRVVGLENRRRRELAVFKGENSVNDPAQ
nr:MAG TPA: Lysozyme [Caudoviricetes sp.]